MENVSKTQRRVMFPHAGSSAFFDNPRAGRQIPYTVETVRSVAVPVGALRHSTRSAGAALGSFYQQHALVARRRKFFTCVVSLTVS